MSAPQFVYLKESFCPSLDEEVAVLYEVPTLAYVLGLYGLWACTSISEHL